MNDSAVSETPRVIGALSGFAIVAGSMVGIGIFLSPPIVAAHVTSTPLFFTMWALGGLTALAGAVACAELGTMMPKAGGDYVFQYEAFGPSTAFASGSVLFAAIFCGSIATLAVGLATYQLPEVLGLDLSAPIIPLPSAWI
jgi:APA family basic amino acid/polyamine antiporter